MEKLEPKQLGVVAVDLHERDERSTWYQYGSYETCKGVIEETLCLADELKLPIFGMEYKGTPMEQRFAQFVPFGNMLRKPRHSGYRETEFDQWLSDAGVDTALYLGFNRDVCVRKTVKGGLKKGIDAVTCLQLMLSCPPDTYWGLNVSEAFFRNSTIFCETIDQVHELLRDPTKVTQFAEEAQRRKDQEHHRSPAQTSVQQLPLQQRAHIRSASTPS